MRWSDCTDVQSELRLCCSHMTDTFSHGPAHIKILRKFVETEPEYVFEIGFQYTTWNGKENILSENKFGKKSCFSQKIMNSWNFQKFFFMQKAYSFSDIKAFIGKVCHKKEQMPKAK